MNFRRQALDCSDAGDRGDVTIDWVFCGPSYAYSYMTSPAGGLKEIRTYLIKFRSDEDRSGSENVDSFMKT